VSRARIAEIVRQFLENGLKQRAIERSEAMPARERSR
jgi:hypothetical protein